MPPRSPSGQPAGRHSWFATAAGQALLASEAGSVHGILAERSGQPWLWLSPGASGAETDGRGLLLTPASLSWVDHGWTGSVRCALPLPLANESVATIVIQHCLRGGRPATVLLSECARVLVPGGRLWLFALNPLSPYRWRWSPGWSASGLAASEPMPWRRRLREAGLQPDPVSQGVGPRWRIEVSPELQQGPGIRAAWLLRAEKRTLPLTPVRNRAALRLGEGVPAA